MLRRLLCTGLLLVLAGCAASPSKGDAGIREVEQAQVQAALSGNRAALEKIFAAEFRLINPAGAVASREELLAMLSGGAPPYRAAVYTTDSVLPYGQVVITTGTETVEFGSGAQAGQKQKRRITQVWERRDGRWQLVLRQATLVAVP